MLLQQSTTFVVETVVPGIARRRPCRFARAELLFEEAERVSRSLVEAEAGPVAGLSREPRDGHRGPVERHVGDDGRRLALQKLVDEIVQGAQSQW